MKGHFITFEGGDGAGKTTLIEAVYLHLIDEGFKVIKTRAPGGTEPGKVIRDLILHPKEPLEKRAELFLFLADRSHHVEKVIRPALENGYVVLCDRYNDSTRAYQGGARGFDEVTIDGLCHFATDGLEPELTLYLDIDPEIALQRSADKDQIEAEDLNFHKRIRKAFHRIGEEYPERFKLVDASQSKEKVLKEALKIIHDSCFTKLSQKG